MKAVGRNLANVQKGEAPITIGYDLQAAVWRDRLKGQVPLEVVVPSEGVFFMPGALMINQWAPHPNLARLFTDFVLSDEGQRLFAKGYAHPIRVVAGNLTLAADQNPRPITQLGSQHEIRARLDRGVGAAARRRAALGAGGPRAVSVPAAVNSSPTPGRSARPVASRGS
jgi:ABC-type Fe3+ transport system substrate-binding protein